MLLLPLLGHTETCVCSTARLHQQRPLCVCMLATTYAPCISKQKEYKDGWDGTRQMKKKEGERETQANGGEVMMYEQWLAAVLLN